jgi:hypothetical protein
MLVMHQLARAGPSDRDVSGVGLDGLEAEIVGSNSA